MKKKLFAIIMLALVTWAATPRILLARPTVENVQLRISLEDTYVDLPAPCEDLVHLGGTLHLAGHLQEMANGDRLVVLHSNPQGAVTQGVETGNIYRGVGVAQSIERTLGPGESFHSVDVFMQVPHFGLVYVVHTTIDAQGELTAAIDHYVQSGFSCDA